MRATWNRLPVVQIVYSIAISRSPRRPQRADEGGLQIQTGAGLNKFVSSTTKTTADRGLCNNQDRLWKDLQEGKERLGLGARAAPNGKVSVSCGMNGEGKNLANPARILIS
jgi:hypothetical protein